MCQGVECNFIWDLYSTLLGKVMTDVEVAKAAWCADKEFKGGEVCVCDFSGELALGSELGSDAGMPASFRNLAVGN